MTIYSDEYWYYNISIGRTIYFTNSGRLEITGVYLSGTNNNMLKENHVLLKDDDSVDEAIVFATWSNEKVETTYERYRIEKMLEKL